MKKLIVGFAALYLIWMAVEAINLAKDIREEKIIIKAIRKASKEN